MTENKYFGASVGLIVGLLLVVLAVFVALPTQANAATKNDKPATQARSKQKKQTSKKTQQQAKPDVAGKTYNYVAQPGDSYTLMARKAVETYGLVHHVMLSGAQIIFCETNLTQAAGSPRLDVGQKVTIKPSVVQTWTRKAQQLNKAQLAAWHYYVQFVNFNTDNVGQSRN